jgi:hypothetical protein
MIRAIFPAFLATCLLAACVDGSGPEVGTTESEITTYSITTVNPAGPSPLVSQWSGILPADVNGGDQVWLFTPATQGGFHLQQVNPTTNAVTYHTVVNANQYPTAVQLAGGRNGVLMSIRNPPPPPPPWTEDLAARNWSARFGANLGRHARYAPNVPWWQ